MFGQHFRDTECQPQESAWWGGSRILPMSIVGHPRRFRSRGSWLRQVRGKQTLLRAAPVRARGGAKKGKVDQRDGSGRAGTRDSPDVWSGLPPPHPPCMDESISHHCSPAIANVAYGFDHGFQVGAKGFRNHPRSEDTLPPPTKTKGDLTIQLHHIQRTPTGRKRKRQTSS